jgi:hypothetical protein
MEGRECPEGMTEEQFVEARRILELTEQARQDELWRMACLLASKKDGELLGQTEFELRDRVLRFGGTLLEAAVNGRKKKAATSAVALLAEGHTTAARAIITRSSSAGERSKS